MPTTAELLARALREAGITRMFGLPGGEILDFMDAARREGIDFLLTRHEATASFMADVTGQIQRRPGVCVATLGPGAVNMTLGVANAYLDQSPLVAITATLARTATRVATHQDLDLNAVYRPFTKLALTLDGEDTEAKVRCALAAAVAPRMGPVHLALPSDVARAEDRVTGRFSPGLLTGGVHEPDAIDQIVTRLQTARRPIVILGLDLNPHTDATAVREFVDRLAVPVFVTPKAKGMLPEDHPLFYGVCGGVSADSVVLECFARADLLVGVGFEPVESDKLWHDTDRIVSLGPVSIAHAEFRPAAEAIGDVNELLATLGRARLGPYDWRPEDRCSFRSGLDAALRPAAPLRGLRLRADAPAARALSARHRARHRRRVREDDYVAGLDQLRTTDLLRVERPLGDELQHPGAMAAVCSSRTIPDSLRDRRRRFRRDGLGEVGTYIRERLHFVTVVYNDSSLEPDRRFAAAAGMPDAWRPLSMPWISPAASPGLGTWTRPRSTMEQLDAGRCRSVDVDGPAVIDVVVKCRRVLPRGSQRHARRDAPRRRSGAQGPKVESIEAPRTTTECRPLFLCGPQQHCRPSGLGH